MFKPLENSFKKEAIKLMQKSFLKHSLLILPNKQLEDLVVSIGKLYIEYVQGDEIDL